MCLRILPCGRTLFAASLHLLLGLTTLLPVQDALEDLRPAFREVEVSLRPRLFLAMPIADAPVSDCGTPKGGTASAEESQSSPEKPLEATKTLFLKIDGSVKGVLQVHQAGLLMHHSAYA